MGEAVDRLMGDMPDSSLGTASITARSDASRSPRMNERLQEQGTTIKLVALRAGGCRDRRDIRAGSRTSSPLLLPHTAYKSYPESFLTEKKWDRLTKWLGTVSPIRPTRRSLRRQRHRRLDRACASRPGTIVSCSSGTTGKSAMLIASQADMDWSQRGRRRGRPVGARASAQATAHHRWCGTARSPTCRAMRRWA